MGIVSSYLQNYGSHFSDMGGMMGPIFLTEIARPRLKKGLITPPPPRITDHVLCILRDNKPDNNVPTANLECCKAINSKNSK